ncbi:Abi-like protein [Helicobacter sp. MIT 00-7814]|uniref:Abi family protein n=1 Tax=unclassified Helicobacter TaxID=2593540 RepID=UPI000E1E301D|nr:MULTISPECIES: Abi family protein [unclassified Helicobacter]RDU53019.1 Abi-like protein [Helicobacter sp. MIT 99-10781]RDU55365.1 Abi-like protein [Helicobacter sp. MIT 00-7814]
MKAKLNINEQILHMQSLGVAFELYSEQKAKEFLTYNNYYFKIKSYAKNYDKYKGKYKNLDFAYLVEFSTLDMHLRRFILELSLDVEHLLKVSLNAHFCNNRNEDGYNIVKDFLTQNTKIKEQILAKSQDISFVKNLLSKYNAELALWNLIEILSYGDFLKFYKFYFEKYPNKENLYPLAYCVRILRNATAHSNCILNTLKIPYNSNFKPNKILQSYLANIKEIPESARKKINKNPMLHDFSALILLFMKLCTSQGMKKAKRKELLCLFRRFKKNKYFFSKNNFIRSQFIVFQKIAFFVIFSKI